MRNLEDVIDEILAVSTYGELNNVLKNIKDSIWFTAPEMIILRWEQVGDALSSFIPNPFINDETIEIACIFTGYTETELRNSLAE